MLVSFITEETTMLKTYHGSCHCQAVRYEADIDLSKGTGRCNCTLCSKTRNWGVTVKPDAFRLLSGQDALAAYVWNSKQAQRLFCKHCGVASFGRGDIPEIGGAYVSVAVSCLDDATVDELMSGPITFMDGRHDNWFHAPAETRHL